MIFSMTGYGKGSTVKNNFSAEVEIKSVNSRFLEIFLKLPPLLSNREYEMREILKSKIKRGKINVTVQLIRNGNNDLAMVNETKLKNYISLIERIKKTTGIKEEIKLEHILNNRDIISSFDIYLSETEFNLVKKALKSAVDELLKMRKDEGKELTKDLIKRIKTIERRIVLIEKEFKKSVNSYFKKLKERIKKLTGEAELDEQRLNLELAAIADKADITEECVRLKSHLKFFINSMNKQAEPGRKLNFLCQELNRETNTISSKSISTTLTHNAVLIKEEIEKIREQIQNIE
ncbi:MAG: YicC family protein [Bacteroidetes bacterium]|nr:YicC family protein [Bacteroidota bacterium]